MSKKYVYNEKLFDENDEFNSYFLGLLYADGYFSKGSISLCLKDYEILEKIKNKVLLEDNNDFITVTKMGFFRMAISNKKIKERLKELGCYREKKSFFLNTPYNFIKEENLRHFIRGFFDGDGTLVFNEKKNSARFKITSVSKKILEEFLTYFSTQGIKGSIYTCRTWNDMCICKREYIMKIYDLFYNDSSIFFFRKQNKFIYALNTIKKQKEKVCFLKTLA